MCAYDMWNIILEAMGDMVSNNSLLSIILPNRRLYAKPFHHMILWSTPRPPLGRQDYLHFIDEETVSEKLSDLSKS